MRRLYKTLVFVLCLLMVTLPNLNQTANAAYSSEDAYTLRSTILKYMHDMGTVKWVAGKQFSNTTKRTFLKNKTYYGIPYYNEGEVNDASLYAFKDLLDSQDGYLYALPGHNDCSTAIGLSYKYAFDKHTNEKFPFTRSSPMYFCPGTNNFIKVGPYTLKKESGDTAKKCGERTCDYNGKDTMFSSYRMMRSADVLIGGEGHVMLVVSVDKDNQTVTVTHQSNAWLNYYPSTDTVASASSNDASNTTWGVNQVKSFKTLFDGNYFPARYKVLDVPDAGETQIQLKFNSNGGSGNMSTQTLSYCDTAKLSKNTFSNIGYQFKGWYAKRNKDNTWCVPGQGWLTESQISQGGFSKKLYQDQAEMCFNKSWTGGAGGTVEFTLYAQWQETSIRIVYMPNGAQNSEELIQNVPFGETVDLMENPFTRAGYTFEGWYANRISDDKWFVSGKGWLTEDEISSGGYSKKLYADQSSLTFNDSWTDGNSGTVTIHLYAQWSIKWVTVSYSISVGGCEWKTIPKGMMRSGSRVYTSLRYGDKYGEQPTVTRDGYIFKGWYTSTIGGTRKTERSVVNIDGNHLLFAQWEKIHSISLTIISAPEKTTYSLGENVDLNGLVLKSTRNDGTTETFTEGFSCTTSVLTEVGEQSISVLCDGRYISITVLVEDDTVNRTLGDINDDNVIDLKDVILMERYLAGGWYVMIDENTADVNQDNSVDLKDVIMLERYLAGGWNIVLN